MAKKKASVERSKTDKSIKADHEGQNIIQTVKVIVQAPKEQKKSHESVSQIVTQKVVEIVKNKL